MCTMYNMLILINNNSVNVFNISVARSRRRRRSQREKATAVAKERRRRRSQREKATAVAKREGDDGHKERRRRQSQRERATAVVKERRGHQLIELNCRLIEPIVLRGWGGLRSPEASALARAIAYIRCISACRQPFTQVTISREG